MTNENNTLNVVRRRPKKIGRREKAGFEDRQRLILTAAAQLFAVAGYSHTTIGDICNELKVSKPTIYHYFKNKDAVMAGVFELADEAMAEKIGAVHELEGTGATILGNMFVAYGEFTASDLGRCITEIDFQLLSTPTRKLLADKREEFMIIMTDLVNDAIEDGSMKKCDPTLLAYNLSHLCYAVVKFHDKHPARSLTEELRKTWEMIAQGTVNPVSEVKQRN
nr:TetR/AcrR family transcriptional regulator [Hyphomonas sp. Mor2]